MDARPRGPLAWSLLLAAIGLIALALVAWATRSSGAAPGTTYRATIPMVARDPTNTPTPTPTPSPTPTVTPTPSRTPVAAGVITNGPRTSNRVALTLDMGGRVDPALDIMNWLLANHVQATIFMTGAMADNQYTDAGRDVLAIVGANLGQFALGNHSYSHPDFTTLTAQEMRDELSRTETSIAKYTSRSPRPLFRPPFGAYDGTVVSTVAGAGYTYVIMWDVDTIDWMPESDGGPTTQQIVDKVLNNAKGGSIVLMHLGGYHTFEALPRIVAGLRAKGLEPTTLTDLLGLATGP